MFPTMSMTNEYDAQMYGRFRHVERQHPRYRHAPFDWYRPPKQRCNIVHEDAAVVTLDGPVPIGDFYRHYIYGDDESDEYDDDIDSIGSGDDELNEGGSRYEPRSSNYRRSSRTEPDLDDESLGTNRPGTNTGNYMALNPNRRTSIPQLNPMRPARYQGNRTLAGDDDFNDAASVNSTYGN